MPLEKKKTSSIDFLKPIKKISKQFGLTLFAVFIIASLSGAVLVINNVITESATDSSYSSSINAGTIDKVTLSRLNALHTSNEIPAAPTTPEGRSNPFSD